MKTAELNHQAVTKKLAEFLADTYVLYVKTQNFHWNIVDPRFYSLHKMLEEQYEDLADAADLIAERLRGLNSPAPGTLKEFLSLTNLEEPEGHLTGDEMIEQLYNDHMTIAKGLHAKITEANDLHDDGTADLYIERIRVHEKTAWMLRSHLKNASF